MGPKTAYYWIVLRRHNNLSVSVLEQNKQLTNRKHIVNYEGRGMLIVSEENCCRHYGSRNKLCINSHVTATVILLCFIMSVRVTFSKQVALQSPKRRSQHVLNLGM